MPFAFPTPAPAIPRRPMLAALGGVHEGNASAFARAGTDLLVTTSAPCAASPPDLSVAVAPGGT